MAFWQIFIFFCFDTILACDNQTLNSSLFAKNNFIKIYNHPIAKLCQEMFSRIPKIDVLIITNCQVKEIEANFLEFHPNVGKIQITHNKILKIQSESFKNVATLSIGLSFNEIEVVESQSFKNLKNLTDVLLNNNKIASFDNKWFDKVPQLTVLDLTSNYIQILPENSFKFLETKNAQLYFDFNKISILHKKTMAGTSAKNLSLYLSNNIIKKIPNGFFKNLTFDQVDLLNNPLEESPEDFFISEITIQTLSVPLHKFKEKSKKKLTKWAAKNKIKLLDSPDFFEEDNCSSKILINLQVFLLLLLLRQHF